MSSETTLIPINDTSETDQDENNDQESQDPQDISLDPYVLLMEKANNFRIKTQRNPSYLRLTEPQISINIAPPLQTPSSD